MSILLKSVNIVDYRQERKCDLLIKDGIISAIDEILTLPDSVRVIEGESLTLLPSFIDLHSHFRYPGQTHKEDLLSGSRAAVHGGYTTVHLMPNTSPVVSSMEILEDIRAAAKAVGLCQIVQSMSITKDFDGTTLDHLDQLDDSVKWLTDDGKGISSTETMLAALRFVKAHHMGLMLHEEDSALTPVDSYLSEELHTFRDCQLAGLTGARVHFCHVSTKNCFNYIEKAKQSGAPITCEVTPHHLVLNDSFSGNVAPPLRGEAHRLAAIEAVKSGLVDAIATDHAPHTPQEKAAGANGFTGLDLSFATCYTSLVKTGEISLSRLSQLMSSGPADILGVEGGEIAVGAPANLVLVDLNKMFTASEKDIHSKSKNSPMLGKTLWGEVNLTIWKGRIVYEKSAD